MPTLAFDQQRLIFDGELGALKEHRHAAIAVLVGIDRCFALQTRDVPERLLRLALIPADVYHRLDFFEARTLVVYIEPHDAIYTSLHRSASGTCLEEPHLPEVFEDALTHWQARSDSAPLIEAIRSHFGAEPVAMDPRLRKLVRAWNEGQLLTAEVEELAAHVALSPSRLLHLHKAELSVGVRRLKQHYRFKLALTTLAHGGSLTQAAHFAGFSDSAHLSRAFSETFGLSPVKVFGVPVRWMTENPPE